VQFKNLDPRLRGGDRMREDDQPLAGNLQNEQKIILILLGRDRF